MRDAECAARSVPAAAGERRPTAASALARYAEAGVLGGAVVFLVEAVDRLAVLWPSFNSSAEPFLYLAYLAPDVLLGALAGFALGAALILARLARLGAHGALGRLPERARTPLAIVLTVVVVALALRGLSMLSPGSLEEPLFRVADKVDGRLVKIGFVVKNFSLLFTLGLGALVAGLLAADVALGERSSRRGRVASAVAGFAFVAALVAVYCVDSRLYFGRYEWTMHVPAALLQLALAFLAAGLVRAAFGSGGAGRRAATRIAGGVLLAAVVASAFAAFHLGANENLKALLWRRSVVARRAFAAVAAVADRDGDGFTSLFRGGDLDDANPEVNPMATEVPGNGVDDNCVGGDAAPEAAGALAERPAPPATGAGFDFVFIAIDTQRADRMSLYGYDRPTTPRLSEWAASAVVFDRAYSYGSNTGIAFAAINRGATREGVFAKDRSTLWGTLAEAGYVTAQVNARRDDAWLETKRWRRYRRSLLEGVQTVVHTSGESLWDADEVTDAALEYLGRLPQGTRHATWIHYLDPHEPRRKMAPFDFGDSDSDKYDSEVAFADREIGRLLDSLRSSGALERSIVVLMADHGESFQDHGMDLHGNRPYDEQIRVPLMIWAPGVAPARVATPVSTIGINPTVLGYLGLLGPPFDEGQALLGDLLRPLPVFSETPNNLQDVNFFAYAVTDGDWRLIYDVRGSTVELYNLADDPRELRNLADSEPVRLAAMRATLARWLDTTASVRLYAGQD